MIRLKKTLHSSFKNSFYEVPKRSTNSYGDFKEVDSIKLSQESSKECS